MFPLPSSEFDNEKARTKKYMSGVAIATVETMLAPVDVSTSLNSLKTETIISPMPRLSVGIIWFACLRL